LGGGQKEDHVMWMNGRNDEEEWNIRNKGRVKVPLGF